jgi:HSP20 family protein
MEVNMTGRFSSALDTLMALQEAVESARKEDYFGFSTTSSGVKPSVNLFQDGDSIIMMAEIPGVKKEDIQLKIKDNLITLSGERRVSYPEKASVHRLERRGVKFDRTLKLPFRVAADKVVAEVRDGVLKVTLPREESDKPKQISIN